jgi:thioredoxin 1
MMSKLTNINNDNFEQEVVQSAIPVLVDFWAAWCGPCLAIAPVIEEIADERSASVKVVKVDVDKNPDLAGRFEVRSIPTLLLFESGELRDQLVGVVSKQTILDKLDEVVRLQAVDFSNGPSGFEHEFPQAFSKA